MVPRSKRLLYSIFSVIAGALIFNLFLLLLSSDYGSFAAFLVVMGFTLLFSFPGWLIAIPTVVIWSDIRGWRFWMYLGIGSSIGPIWIFVLMLYPFLRAPNQSAYSRGPTVLAMLGLAAAVSGPATLIYLLLLRRAQGVATKEINRPHEPSLRA